MKRIDTIAKAIARSTIDLYLAGGFEPWDLDANKIAFEVTRYMNHKDFNANEGRSMLEEYVETQIRKLVDTEVARAAEKREQSI